MFRGVRALADEYNFNYQPYYIGEKKFSVSNQRKAKLGEEAFAEALVSYYPIIMNVNYGKRQRDIDHLVLTPQYLVMNECKNTKENWKIEYSWFLSHIVNRYTTGLPIAQFYATTLGYTTKIIFTLTIPTFNTDNPIVQNAVKGLKINVIEGWLF